MPSQELAEPAVTVGLQAKVAKAARQDREVKEVRLVKPGVVAKGETVPGVAGAVAPVRMGTAQSPPKTATVAVIHVTVTAAKEAGTAKKDNVVTMA